MFAVDTGQGLSEHTAPFDALVYLIEGEAEVKVGGTFSTIKAGERMILPANLPHAVNSKKRFKMMLVMIRS